MQKFILNHEDEDGEWNLAVSEQLLTVTKHGETREYDLPSPVTCITVHLPYLYIEMEGQLDIVQLKLEVEGTFIGDIFRNGEHQSVYAMWAFEPQSDLEDEETDTEA